jgi:hypothetical protein
MAPARDMEPSARYKFQTMTSRPLHGVKTKFRPLADDLFIGFAFPGMGASGGESTSRWVVGKRR